MKNAIIISLLLTSMINYGMEISDRKIDQFFALCLAATGVMGTIYIMWHANNLANESAKEQAALKAQDPNITLMNRYMREYEKEKEQKNRILASEQRKKEELAQLNNYLGTLPPESNDITQFKQWVTDALTTLSKSPYS